MHATCKKQALFFTQHQAHVHQQSCAYVPGWQRVLPRVRHIYRNEWLSTSSSAYAWGDFGFEVEISKTVILAKTRTGRETRVWFSVKYQQTFNLLSLGICRPFSWYHAKNSSRVMYALLGFSPFVWISWSMQNKSNRDLRAQNRNHYVANIGSRWQWYVLTKNISVNLVLVLIATHHCT